MAWFPSQWNTSNEGWKFEIVSLLAVIGGSTIEKHKQAITASRLGVIPRLLPAPDTLLNTDRPLRLPSVKDVTVYGVHSGTHTNELNFFANIIHNVESLASYEFRLYSITYGPKEHDVEKIDKTGEKDVENIGNTVKKDVFIPVKTLSMLNAVTVFSIIMTIGLFILAGISYDGVALIGLVSMSLSTSAACLSAQWRPKLNTRPNRTDVPPGDVAIKTRGGAIIIVQCQEEITRELYLGMDTCQYTFTGQAHQALLATSTILLMAAIIFFSNCGRTMQVAVGVAYIILNILYWVMALLQSPQKASWDIDRYHIETLLKDDKPKSFTEVLWYAVRETKCIDWIKNAGLAPGTESWNRWLQEALKNCDNPEWDAVGAKNQLMKEAARNEKEQK
ncbi:hypothetical protein BDV59DRAFT_193215 [Aspergillus ambiguus]|uniref:uncharacterized protein n=1 Tax=Aspergillus ambiguus TaxID=176160 RepID=UPI003CCCC78C